MLFKDGFYRSFSKEWRFNMRALHLIALAFYVFMIACWVWIDNFEPTGHLMLGIALLVVVNLVRDAVVEGNRELEQNPTYQPRSGLVSVGLLFFCIVVFAASTYGQELEKTKRKASQTWALSEFCVENGEYRDRRLKACARLAWSARLEICKLGADPMNACEVELRKRLRKPKSPAP